MSSTSQPHLGFSLFNQAEYYNQLLHLFGGGRFRGVVTDAKTQESKGTYVYDFTQEVANGYRQWQDNFSPKWYLSAIPSDEVRKSHGSLVQNPGW